MMLKQTVFWLIMILLFSCSSNHESSAFTEDTRKHETVYEVVSDTVHVAAEDESNEQWYIYERLPEWFIEAEIAHELIIDEKYRIDNRLNPMYLEEDFNGDSYYDIALPVIEISSEKAGFAIIHGKSNQIFIVGAGSLIEGLESDDLSYIDIWRLDRDLGDIPRDEQLETDELPLKYMFNLGIEILKSEVGGGLIYWTGEGYTYLHQTC